MLQRLLEGEVTSRVACCTCDTTSERQQPVWVMTLPLPPDTVAPESPGKATAAPQKSSAASKSGAKKSSAKGRDGKGSGGGGAPGETAKMSKKELKALEKAEKRARRRARKRDAQRQDAGAEPEDLSDGDGDLSGAPRPGMCTRSLRPVCTPTGTPHLLFLES